MDARGGGFGDGGEPLALLVLGVGGAVDEDDAPALHHLAEAAQALHRRADLHPLRSPARHLPRGLLAFLPSDSSTGESDSWLGFGGGTHGPGYQDQRKPGP